MLVCAPTRAETRSYLLEAPGGEAASFVLDFPVLHPGTLGLRAEWSGTRLISFRVEGPGSPAVKFRRTGPSPQRIEIEVGEEAAADGEPWRLFIRALPGRPSAQGTLTLVLPEPPGATPAKAPPERRPAARAAEPADWAKPSFAPAGASRALAEVFEAAEALRTAIVGEDGTLRRDACGWHGDLLRYVADSRDGMAREGRVLSEASGRFLSRIAELVWRVEQLRSTDDPAIAGPAPENREERRAWNAARRRRIAPLEADLDRLNESLRSGFAPELEQRTWPQRLIGCLMACERYFEQRARLGEHRAANRRLALDQWDGLLAAAGALQSLAAFDGAGGRARRP